MEANQIYDAIIVGGGPAGLTAAIYLARARYRVLVVEKERFGGQITITHEVVNYPGIESTSGEALTETMRHQAQNFCAEFLVSEVTDLKLDGDIKQVVTSKGVLNAFAVLIATGANPRRVGFNGEQSFRGRGVAYCATCDGEFFTGKELLVIGGGYAAAEEAMFLTRYASKITMLVRKDKMSCAQSIIDEVSRHPKITILYNHELEFVEGDENGINRASIFNNKTQDKFIYQAKNNDTFGVFVFAGYEPNTSLVKDKVATNEQGYIITDDSCQTNIPGVFAAGDVCIKPLRQVVTAVADGALAACAMEKVAAIMHEKTGIVPDVPNATRKSPEEPRASFSPDTMSSKFISEDMKPQLNAVFERMGDVVTLEVHSNGNDKSRELYEAMKDLSDLTDKLELTQVSDNSDTSPCVKLMRDGKYTGLAFHGIPGGHEFTSFILGIYNSSGTGQPIEDDDKNAILALDKKIDIKILISLSCTMCPELVIAAQRIASLNENVTAEVYDLNLFPDLRAKYKVMSVPCLVINDGENISFGRKNLNELLAILNSK